ncbi:MAG: rod shape-determining protein MreC [Candidatus Magasanikbacteria bacterium RIFCSPHIGHO2_01_FULL_33_34]|uniref:Cell shape-determining protein MreC n=1 Tax=Candidatus Magasanikbacteria bacterium RIFCSPHIGHO2_01_FULL_33_34 TaxID=1798671 RepID=A0A1F6LL67_9BACT|nr:MAG: rod shape-determining protein MreC [Candidatus Magasanikbacteria bacterium RIFCSPHIGHO2_01_FULL_33_34]OGH65862.1 MAG: rod shape-determining protein MreC [Candidatus Magasanikbacteria bacterium RIFCSPHIGHO2_02_FULL_33_17]OGH75227.1 MAG: rod shape-determining protein MreC [Candidatus Magasanikbacteria bacterium RIFCSPLOWO2_01_FULL_33_34]OGH81862.1 MAG: rod shape-determining protein MreC [Candidatus Magasanikbacteria bacterium RIFCSPLOWO2_12_FULL_34_7]
MKRRNILVIFFAIFIIILLHYFGVTIWLDNKIRSLFNLSSSAVYNISTKYNNNLEFESTDELKKEYLELIEKYNNNVVDKTQLTLLTEENDNLREQLNFLDKETISIGADVISRSTDVLRNTIVINRGLEDGVLMDLPVITGRGFYIGKIKRVDSNSSVVQLISDQYSRVASTVLNKEKSIGVVEGGFGLSLQMNLIPQNEYISVGEDVITSGLEENIPYGLILGHIDIVEKEPYQPFQKALLSPYVNLNKIQTVSVLLTL